MINLTKKSIKAGSWLLGYNSFARLSGLVKTGIIARILTPAQFGVFGIVTLALSLLETFSETGIDQALIQKENLNSKTISTAWFISILRGLAIGIILFLTAPLVATFFNNPQVTDFIRFISIAPIIRNLRNPYVVFFRKKLEFHKEFIMRSMGTLAELIVGITVSILTQSILGLVAAVLAGAISETIISYLLIPVKKITRPSRTSAKELFSFSGWLWGSSILSYLVNQGDDIVVGKLLGTQFLGFYQNAYKIASLPATQISSAISQVTFPAFSAIKEDKIRLNRAFRKTLLTTSAVSLPATGLIIVLAKPLTLLVLGPKWLPVIPALQVLSIYGAIRSISSIAGPILKAAGKTKVIASYGVIRLIALTVLIFPLTNNFGMLGASWAVVISIIISQPYLFIKVKRVLS